MSKPSTGTPPPTAAARQERARKTAIEGEKAWAEVEASAAATEAKTLRLRALRLERDAAEAAEAAPAKAAKVAAAPKKITAKAAAKAAAAPPPAKKPIRRNVPIR